MRRWAIGGCVLLLVVAAAGCGQKQARRSPTVPVSVARAESRDVPNEIEATGTVEPQQTVEVLAQVGGTLERVAFREGDNVTAGQALFHLDARPFQAAYEQAAAVLARDRATFERAEREAERARALQEQGMISAGEYDDKRATAQAAAANVRADSAAASTARLNLQHTVIRAPIPGRTGRVGVHAGDLVKPGDSGNTLVTINQLRPVRVRFTVPQDALPAVLRGRSGPLEVRVSAGEDSVFPHVGRLVFVDNAVDPASGTLLLKAEFDNRDEALWPGEFVRVLLKLSSDPNATVVPSVAVTTGPEGTYVYIVQADSTVAVRPVVVARTYEEQSVIARGVEPGETVVTDGQLRLAPGARVLLRRQKDAGDGTRSASTGEPEGRGRTGEAAAATRGGRAPSTEGGQR